MTNTKRELPTLDTKTKSLRNEIDHYRQALVRISEKIDMELGEKKPTSDNSFRGGYEQAVWELGLIARAALER